MSHSTVHNCATAALLMNSRRVRLTDTKRRKRICKKQSPKPKFFPYKTPSGETRYHSYTDGDD